jgi:hypothetical protein
MQRSGIPVAIPALTPELAYPTVISAAAGCDQGALIVQKEMEGL